MREGKSNVLRDKSQEFSTDVHDRVYERIFHVGIDWKYRC